jgi:hypothetical protein
VVTGEVTGGLVYEIRIPAAELGADPLAEGREMGFTMLVNDADGEGREGWVEWTPGIGAFKEPDSFGMIRLVTVPSVEPDDVEPVAETSEPGPDASADAIDDPVVDGWTDPAPPGGRESGCGCTIVG